MNKKIIVTKEIKITDALNRLKNSGSRCLVVIDKNNTVIGTLSDGDLRKKIISAGNTRGIIKNVYNKKPYIIELKDLKIKSKKIFDLFVKKKLPLIPIVQNKNKKYLRSLFYDDFLKEKEEKKIIIKKIKCPVVIMAGGKGTRLKPFTNILPKPLMPLKDKTVIENIILSFAEQGFKDFIITINYKSEILKSYFKELNLKYNIRFIEEKNELGTVGSLKLIKNLEKNFILTNCDNLYKFNLRELFSYHSSNNNDLTLAISKKKIEVPYGVCEINSKNALKSINEKPSYNLFVNTGLYIINKRIIKHIPEKKKFGIDELINILIDKKYELQTFKINENQWFDTGQWDQFKKTFNQF